MPAYYGQVNTSCALDRCLTCVKEMIGWEEKYPVRDMGNGKVRAVGMGMAMQGSGITSVDVEARRLRSMMTDFTRFPSALPIWGTGCDTILAQIAAEVLECSVEEIIVLGCRHGFLSV